MLKFFPRESGVLLHISSLPGPYGIGEIGPEAYRFVDTLSEMGQSLWQILPTGDTGSCNSPYSTVSAFANHPLLISFDMLIEDGFLEKLDLIELQNYSHHNVDFEKVIPDRLKIMNGVCHQFFENASSSVKKHFETFCTENNYWLDTYTLFLALKEYHNQTTWTEWDEEYSIHGNGLSEIRTQYESYIQSLKIKQFLFNDQWKRLKAYANEKGIRIIGDIPIYISHDSADVWANPELFKLDENGNMKFQSGCPPDFFLKDGQVWGHPIYDWKAHEKTDYKWWIDRLKYLFTLVDIVRIDHFNGFAKYWEIPMESSNGVKAKWVKGPGEKLLTAVRKKLGNQPIIAEDLGDAASDAKIIREEFDIPGMKVLQMAFGEAENLNESIPELEIENIVVYTGTHDNDTTIGWFQTKPGKGNIQTADEIAHERNNALELLGTDGSQINWDLISLAMQSKSNTVIIPLQDILGLDEKARMNTPGTIEGNWEWRFQKNQLTKEIIERMKILTKDSNRLQSFHQ